MTNKQKQQLLEDLNRLNIKQEKTIEKILNSVVEKQEVVEIINDRNFNLFFNVTSRKCDLKITTENQFVNENLLNRMAMLFSQKYFIERTLRDIL